MTLWQYTFGSLALTAVLGIYLFVGYTFRIRVRYPLIAVTLHVLSALLTVVLFSVLSFREGSHVQSGHNYGLVVLWISLAIVLVTFISGLYFYFYYNIRNRGLGAGLLATHLLLAALAFVGATSSISLMAKPAHPMQLYHGTMYNYYKHHAAKAR